MGMFDYIKYKMKCPHCGKMITEFQSKDGDCMLGRLNFWEVEEFYNYCDECGTWIEFTLKEEDVNFDILIDQYEMTVKLPKNSQEDL